MAKNKKGAIRSTIQGSKEGNKERITREGHSTDVYLRNLQFQTSSAVEQTREGTECNGINGAHWLWLGG